MKNKSDNECTIYNLCKVSSFLDTYFTSYKSLNFISINTLFKIIDEELETITSLLNNNCELEDFCKHESISMSDATKYLQETYVKKIELIRDFLSYYFNDALCNHPPFKTYFEQIIKDLKEYDQKRISNG
jgi:F0F1-type ATP synthase delta subunit